MVPQKKKIGNKEDRHMKKLFAILMMAATLAACSLELQPTLEDAPQKYSMTVLASKGGDSASKALTIDDSGSKNVLNATWAQYDRVTVYNETRSELLDGYLVAQSAGSNTTLKSDLLIGTVNAGDVLTLKFLSPSYGSQDGTLAHIAANCDYAEASVNVASVSGGVISISEPAAEFQNKQAIVKFTLKDEDGSLLARNPSSFTVNDGTSDVVSLSGIPASTFTTNGKCVLYVAVPGIDSKKIELTTVTPDDTFIYNATSAKSFVNGKYYEIAVKMYPSVVDLSYVKSYLLAKNGQTITGALATQANINVAAGASVTLDDVDITCGVNSSTYSWAGITCEGDASIILSGTNVVKGFYTEYPGIQAGPNGTTLTIQGSGSLNAYSEGFAPGIGGATSTDCGDIVILGGTITSTGGDFSAGIGGGCEACCGNISISGGVIVASAGESGAGIGSGLDGICEDITITGGTVTATGGDYAAGIGCGEGYSSGSLCGSIFIGAGVTSVTATKGDGSATESIGKGDGDSTCGTVTIEDPSKVTQN